MLRKSLLLLAFVPAVGTAANTPANNDARFEQLDARIAALEANAQLLRDQAAAAQAEAATGAGACSAAR